MQRRRCDRSNMSVAPLVKPIATRPPDACSAHGMPSASGVPSSVASTHCWVMVRRRCSWRNGRAIGSGAAARALSVLSDSDAGCVERVRLPATDGVRAIDSSTEPSSRVRRAARCASVDDHGDRRRCMAANLGGRRACAGSAESGLLDCGASPAPSVSSSASLCSSLLSSASSLSFSGSGEVRPGRGDAGASSASSGSRHASAPHAYPESAEVPGSVGLCAMEGSHVAMVFWLWLTAWVARRRPSARGRSPRPAAGRSTRPCARGVPSCRGTHPPRPRP